MIKCLFETQQLGVYFEFFQQSVVFSTLEGNTFRYIQRGHSIVFFFRQKQQKKKNKHKFIITPPVARLEFSTAE